MREKKFMKKSIAWILLGILSYFQCALFSPREMAKESPVPNAEFCNHFGNWPDLSRHYPSSFYKEESHSIWFTKDFQNKLKEFKLDKTLYSENIQEESDYDKFWDTFKKYCSGTVPVARINNSIPYVQKTKEAEQKRKRQEEQERARLAREQRIREQQEKEAEWERQNNAKLEQERQELEKRNAEIARQYKNQRREHLLSKLELLQDCNEKWNIWESDSKQLFPMVESLYNLQIENDDSTLVREEKKKLIKKKLLEVNQENIGKTVHLKKLFVNDVQADKDLNAKGKAKLKEIILELKKDPGTSTLFKNGDNPATNLILAFYIAFLLAGCEDCYTPNGEYSVRLSIKWPEEDRYESEPKISYPSYRSGILVKTSTKPDINRFQYASFEIKDEEKKDFPEEISKFSQQYPIECPAIFKDFSTVETEITLKGLSKEKASSLKIGDTISTNAKIVGIQGDNPLFFRVSFELRE